ncbi:MAG: hypothetical protein N3D20_02470 [Candidatus Pacearchaeota archaeon]|nr:hypothetical protein [Candidatus Pacearchaeota archaeon]
MASKLLSYILMGIGIIIILLSYPQISKPLKITLPISDLYLMIIGIIVVIIGAFISFWRSEKIEEVPIYHGEKIVGYRRLKK